MIFCLRTFSISFATRLCSAAAAATVTAPPKRVPGAIRKADDRPSLDSALKRVRLTYHGHVFFPTTVKTRFSFMMFFSRPRLGLFVSLQLTFSPLILFPSPPISPIFPIRRTTRTALGPVNLQMTRPLSTRTSASATHRPTLNVSITTTAT